jgi:hypothetical protein
MNNIVTKIVLGLLAVLLISSVAFGQTIEADPSDYTLGTPYVRDFSYSREGTAPGYDAANHTTDDWQRLGNSSLINDGVAWSIDNRKTWGTDAVMHQGTTVTFRFDFQRTDDGIHTYDQLKSWIDWNGDKDWDDAGEQIIAVKWWQWDQDLETRPENFSNTRRNNGEDVNLIQKYFYAQMVVPTWASLGETWIRTRVHCNHVSFENTTAYGELNQGEVEDYRVIIASPEPSTFILLGVGLLGFGFMARRRRNA